VPFNEFLEKVKAAEEISSVDLMQRVIFLTATRMLEARGRPSAPRVLQPSCSISSIRESGDFSGRVERTGFSSTRCGRTVDGSWAWHWL